MASNNRRKEPHSLHKPKRDQRYQQLIALAREGNVEAAADLFREFGVKVDLEETTHDAD